MERLVKNITRLIAHHNCVILPGVGAFLAHRVPACYNAAEKIFMPPYRTLGFNPQVVVDDALLLSEYMNSGKMSHKEATAALSKDIESLYSNLSSTGIVCFGELGTFTMDIEGKIFFTPNENGIDDPYNYGFEPLAISPLNELKKKDFVIKRSNVRKYISAVAAVVVLAFVLVPFGKKMHNDNTQLSVAGFTTTEKVSRPAAKTIEAVNLVVEEVVNYETSPVVETEIAPAPVMTLETKLPVRAFEIIEIEEEIEEADIFEEIETTVTTDAIESLDAVEVLEFVETVEFEMAEEITESIEPMECVVPVEEVVETVECVEEEAIPVTAEPTVEEAVDADVATELTEIVSVIENKSEKHSIIVASTPNQKNAQLAIKELSRKMKADYEVVEGDRRFRIAIETYDNADDANMALERIQLTFSDAWIYVH